ncbi:hypothetical protein [Roseivivax sediminis]|uniref:Chaperone of endosialidase n=1 Tax=Roseivivax sediminis TaxID=936889 RepID=A0A1I2ABT9_9RHOB|nr:hypothetical protein [Roseivivax sediminis]SFE41356.1 hypothetical protein SAMN04515678_109170 [Roseivivax sediminis]
MRIKFSKELATSAGVAALCLAGAASAQNVINQDTTIRNSLCVGTDCANTESYGSDTFRLKENNLRINFVDTSNSGSFPARDWRIVANDQSNGGDDYLAFEDADAGRQPFRVQGNAPANALRVNSNGNVGFGTASPVLELHVADGDSPGLRLEQDASSGFAAQSWDIAGNETNFFVRDVTNGSTLPFRIQPSAPSNALYVASDGEIGMGTTTPGGALHVNAGGNHADLLLQQTTNNTTWTIRNNEDTGRLTFSAGATTPFKFSPTAAENLFRVGITADNEVDVNGNLDVSGTVTTGGPTCGSGCDAVFDAEYELPSIADHHAEMFALGYLPNVGPTEPYAPFNVSEKIGGMLNELEHAHIYISELNARISELEDKLAAQ